MSQPKIFKITNGSHLFLLLSFSFIIFFSFLDVSSCQHTCSGTGEFSVKDWTNGICDTDIPPFYSDSGPSNKCINTRDGNSIYYDCSKADMVVDNDELNAGNTSGPSNGMLGLVMSVMAILGVVLQW